VRRGILLLVLLIAGCPPDDGSVAPVLPGLEASPGTAAGGPSPSPGAESSPGAATPASTPPSGARQTVRVCLVLPESGESKDVADEMRRGIAVARAEIEAENWRTRRLEFSERPTSSTEPSAVSAYQKCFNEGHPLIIGPLHPAETTALIPVAAAHEAVLLIPEVGAAIPSIWGRNLLAVAPPASEMGHVAAEDALGKRERKKAAVLHVPKVFGETLRDAWKESFSKGGGSVVVSKELDPGKPEAWASAALEAAVKNGVDALFVVGPGEVAEAVAKTLDDEPMGNVHAWFIDWAMFPTVLAAAGPLAVDRVHWVNRPLPKGEFAQTYEARYQAKPDYAAGSGYDAVVVAANAVETAPSQFWEDVAASARGLKGLPSAFGSGTMVERRGIVFLDSAAYRVVEPIQQPETGDWVFGE
jgi:ABC-type branched-subunit amino acid transport system substrate-binding protein